jgi:CO/xanthine dehydrogenase Mo-binding subunit
MTGHLSISRRKLIVGGLMVAFACSVRARAASSEAAGPRAIGGFVRISREGGISLVMPSVEMGQGIYTAEAALLAEELDVRLDQVAAIAAPPDASLYAQPLFKTTVVFSACRTCRIGRDGCDRCNRCRVHSQQISLLRIALFGRFVST